MTETTADPSPPTRFYALDCVRAAAILLGVFYHAVMFGMFTRGGPPGPSMFAGPAAQVQNWMHGFRMPLFFLISGFFGRMMFARYGAAVYLRRRWSRIGLALVFGLFTIIPLFQATRGGPMGGGGPGPGPGPGPGMRPPMAGPPGGSADARRDGPPRSFADMPPPRSGPGGPGSSVLGDRIFGKYSYLFKLEYLWFLWYLLVLATATPLIARVAGALLGGHDEAADRFARGALRRGLAPGALGVAGGVILSLLPATFMPGWSLPLASGIFRGVPDFALRLEPDMAFYLAYFVAGWWLHRLRDSLPGVGRLWLPMLVVGVAAHAGSVALYARYGMGRDLPGYAMIRLMGYLLYGLGSAYAAFGFLGFFQRYVDRPSRVGRYLADTAFWIYVVHEPIMTPFLRLVGPLQLPWYLQGILVAALTSAAALLLYEAVVRRTFLAWIYGPGGGRPGPREPKPALAGNLSS